MSNPFFSEKKTRKKYQFFVRSISQESGKGYCKMLKCLSGCLFAGEKSFDDLNYILAHLSYAQDELL